MDRKEYDRFEEEQLKKFQKYYKECTTLAQKRELKDSVYKNEKLNKFQKDTFWRKIVG